MDSGLAFLLVLGSLAFLSGILGIIVGMAHGIEVEKRRR